MAKTPQEANLYGNWCVRKGLIFGNYLKCKYNEVKIIRISKRTSEKPENVF